VLGLVATIFEQVFQEVGPTVPHRRSINGSVMVVFLSNRRNISTKDYKKVIAITRSNSFNADISNASNFRCLIILNRFWADLKIFKKIKIFIL
jgi:hypothetical protein